MSIFIEHLDMLLCEKGMTRNQLLRELGLGKNSFVNWQTYDTLPHGATLVKLADYFEVSIDWLVGRTKRDDGNT